MLIRYFAAHDAHMARAKLENFKPMKFSQFVSLAKHLNALR